MQPVVNRTHEEAPDCLQMSERHPAGRPVCSDLVSIPGHWDEGLFFMGSRSAHRKLSSLNAVFLIGGTPLFLVSCRHSHSWVLIFAGDECCSMLYSLSPWLLTPTTAVSFYQRLSRDPLNFRQSRLSLGKDCYWLSHGKLLSFPNLAFPKENSGFSPKILSSSLSLPHFCNWNHYSLSGSSPKLIDSLFPHPSFQ